MRQFVVFLLLILATPASALDWAVGAQAMGSSHSLTGDLSNDGSWEGESGLGAGLMFDLGVAHDITISFQPTWTPRRSVQRFELQGEIIGETKFNLEYLVMPLVIRVDSSPRRVQGFVTAGLSLGYLLQATVDDGSGEQDAADQLDDFTVGALFGAGVLVGVGQQRLIFEFRYEQGLDDILDRATPSTYDVQSSPSVKYREFKLIAGVLFGPGGAR